MQISFDPIKRDATLANRGLDFADAQEVFAGPVFERIDDRFDYGEIRYITIGLLRGRMVVLVWTPRGADRHVFQCERQTSVSKPDTRPDWADPEDAPELTDEWFEGADLKVKDKVVRRGRPPGSNKRQVAIRLDKDIIEHFKAEGAGWQSRLNTALREWMATH
jgi:uncharacterized protein